MRACVYVGCENNHNPTFLDLRVDTARILRHPIAEELDGAAANGLGGLQRAESVNGLNGQALAAALGEEQGGGVRAQATAAKEAQRALAALTGQERSAVLREVAKALLAHSAEVRKGRRLRALHGMESLYPSFLCRGRIPSHWCCSILLSSLFKQIPHHS